MFSLKCYLLFGLLLTLLLDSTSGRKSFGTQRHFYPRGGGLSGGSHRSGGLSGGFHGYPNSRGGLSGGGHGKSGSRQPANTGHKTTIHNQYHYTPQQIHNVPTRGAAPVSHPVDRVGHGKSGSRRPANTGHKTTIHNHYHYTPPQQIHYVPTRGAAPVIYPVYRGQPPTYVYQYKYSGSTYGPLLAGLALLNLGKLGAHNSRPSNYKPQPGEVCKFGVKKDNGDYEETKINCQIISSFIIEHDASTQHGTVTNSTVTTSTTVTNMTILNATNGAVDHTSTAAPGGVFYEKLPGGTLVPVNGKEIPVNTTLNATTAAARNGTVTSTVTVTTTTTNTTLLNALELKGKPVEVTPGMQCFVIRHSSISNMRKTVPCGLLQTYADKSIRRNAAAQHVPMFTIVAALVAYCVA